MFKRSRALALVAALVGSAALALSACGGDDDKDATAGAPEELKVAFLPGVTANPYFKAEIEAAEELAAKENVDLTVIDSQLDAEKQAQQLQDLAAAQQYDGVLVVPLSGAAVVPPVQDLIAAGIKVGAVDVPIGPDATSSEPQVEGTSVYSGRPFSVHGKTLGELTIKACEGVDPCRVGFMYGVKASTYDQALYDGFRAAIKPAPNVEVAAEAEGLYTQDGGLTATQDLIQSDADLNVLVAVDQSALGAETALKQAGLADKVKIIGYGGARKAADAIRAGRWFGDAVQVPRTEAMLGLRGVIDAIRDGKDTGYVDPVVEAGVPDSGRITRDNVGSFEPEYEG